MVVNIRHILCRTIVCPHIVILLDTRPHLIGCLTPCPDFFWTQVLVFPPGYLGVSHCVGLAAHHPTYHLQPK
jgi:hypothetical protein